MEMFRGTVSPYWFPQHYADGACYIVLYTDPNDQRYRASACTLIIY